MKIIKLKLSSKIALIAFILSLLGITALAVISYQQYNEIFKNNLLNNITFEVEKTASTIKKKISGAKKDLLFTSNSEPIYGILRTTRNRYNYDEDENMHLSSWKDRLEKLFVVVMEQNPAYFQMRLIGVKEDGREMIRLERKKGEFNFVAEKNLQSKNQTQYFQDTIQLPDGHIYISQINLNREHNIVVTPYIPTIRVATPIYYKDGDHTDTVFGIIVININVSELFNFKAFDNDNNLRTFIANKEGQYLYNKDTDKTFGFEFGRKHLIQDDFNVSNFLDNIKVSNPQHNKSKSFYDTNYDSAIAIQKINLSEYRFITILQLINSHFFKKESESYAIILLIYIIIIAVIIAILIAFSIHYLTAPISQLSTVAKKITEGENISSFSLNIKSGDEIEELSTSFKYMLDSLAQSKNELQHLADSLELEVSEKTKELQALNEGLEKKVHSGIEDLRKKNEALQQQSKLASMGEMIGAIAHQWRQPLNELGISIQNLKYHYINKEINEAFIKDYIQKNKTTINFMSKTIDDFRSFFRVDKEKSNFHIKKSIESVVSMQSAQLVHYNIELSLSGDEFEVNGLRNEFQQVILNVINNAKDVLIEQKISQPCIKINSNAENKIITIQDNAGGIKESVIDRIFEPYFTTKEQGKGTGMGLYMSKMIIEDNMGGNLSVKNNEIGACFKIDLN